jgi:hypothetical protein
MLLLSSGWVGASELSRRPVTFWQDVEDKGWHSRKADGLRASNPRSLNIKKPWFQIGFTRANGLIVRDGMFLAIETTSRHLQPTAKPGPSSAFYDLDRRVGR